MNKVSVLIVGGEGKKGVNHSHGACFGDLISVEK